MLARWVTFMRKGQHYFLWDFCYWVNLGWLIYIWWFPKSDFLFRVLFITSTGPVAWSVPSF